MNEYNLVDTFVSLAKFDTDIALEWYASLSTDNREQLEKEITSMLEMVRIIIEAIARILESWMGLMSSTEKTFVSSERR